MRSRTFFESKNKREKVLHSGCKKSDCELLSTRKANLFNVAKSLSLEVFKREVKYPLEFILLPLGRSCEPYRQSDQSKGGESWKRFLPLSPRGHFGGHVVKTMIVLVNVKFQSLFNMSFFLRCEKCSTLILLFIEKNI